MILAGLFPPWLSGATALEIAAVGAVFLTLGSLYQAFSPREAVNARARAQAQRRKEARAKALAPHRPKQRRRPVKAVRGLLDRLKLTRGADDAKTAELLARAGWRSRDAATMFSGLRVGMPIVIGVLAYMLASIAFHHIPLLLHALIGMIGIGVGAYAPAIFVGHVAQQRRKKIELGLPDALDLFVICSEAGLSLDATIARVAKEMGPAVPELADELGLTTIELGFLPNRGDALANLNKRVNSPAVRNLINTLAQTEKYGTPLAQSLRDLATQFREERMMKAETKGARLPATLTIPMIVFILPPLFVVLIGPAIIQVLAVLHK